MNINKYLQPGESVNVIASAGTGKTWFIISKILRLLLDDVAPEKITAITFTRKTTAEMQTRLNDKIEYSDEHNLNKSFNEYLFINSINKVSFNEYLLSLCIDVKLFLAANKEFKFFVFCKNIFNYLSDIFNIDFNLKNTSSILCVFSGIK